MLLGALLDAGADLAAVQQAVDAVVAGSVLLTAAQVTRAGLRATKAEVKPVADDPPHRSWATIWTMIEEADLAEPVRQRAQIVFAQLAVAEGRVHGIPAEDVEFHEVGALDSIADVVGVAAALHDLGVSSITAGPVALGSGQVRVAHGVIPVPVPAVAELARGWRVSAGDAEGELTTPTGMALLAALAERCEDLPPLTVQRVGVGAGTRDVAGRANVTRVVLGDRGSCVVSRAGQPGAAAGGQRRRPRPAALARCAAAVADGRRRRRLAGSDHDEEGPAGAHSQRAVRAEPRRRAAHRDAGADQHRRGAADRDQQVRPAAHLVRGRGRRGARWRSRSPTATE